MIKILKDICVNQPNFEKITDICIKMIRRINDEEGIKVSSAKDGLSHNKIRLISFNFLY